MHCQQGGEVWARNGLLHAYRRFPSGFELFLSSGSFPGGTSLTGGGHQSDRCSSQVLGDLVHRSDQWGLSWCRCSVSWSGSHAFVQGELHWFRGSLNVCRGSSMWFFEFLVWWFALFAWAWFCLECVEPLPLPKGSKTCLLQVILFFAFVWLRSLVEVSFYSFIFFFFSLVLLFVGVVNSLIKGEIEDHVWFEDRWMVAS
jgi:hypothetical protein